MFSVLTFRKISSQGLICSKVQDGCPRCTYVKWETGASAVLARGKGWVSNILAKAFAVSKVFTKGRASNGEAYSRPALVFAGTLL